MNTTTSPPVEGAGDLRFSSYYRLGSYVPAFRREINQGDERSVGTYRPSGELFTGSSSRKLLRFFCCRESGYSDRLWRDGARAMSTVVLVNSNGFQVWSKYLGNVFPSAGPLRCAAGCEKSL